MAAIMSPRSRAVSSSTVAVFGAAFHIGPFAGCSPLRCVRGLVQEVAMRAKDMLGRHGEELAAEYLQRHGMRILDRNWRCRSGELDIVALDARVLVAAEVKTRRSLDYG